MLYKIVGHQNFTKSKFFNLISSRLLTTVAQQREKWAKKFQEGNVSEPDSSIKNIIASVLHTRNLEEVDRASEIQLNDGQVEKLDSMCLARLCHMPVQYIIKEWDFRDLKGVQMRPPVFIPRPETEELVSLIIEHFKKTKVEMFRFLEIGCGSGVISLSLLKAFPNATCIAIDQSKMAVDLTKVNAANFQLEKRIDVMQYKVCNGDLPEYFHQQEFDLIVSNPPYLLKKELFDLADDIKLYEDLRAVDGGKDGLNIITHILDIACKYLKPSGYLWFEAHPSHPEKLKKHLLSNALNLRIEDVYKDFSGKDRFIKLKLNKN